MSLKVLDNKKFYFHEFIEDCLLALEKASQNPNFSIDMDYWAMDKGKTCSLCMGGALFAENMGFDKALLKKTIKDHELKHQEEYEQEICGIELKYVDEKMGILMEAGNHLRNFDFSFAYSDLESLSLVKRYSDTKLEVLQDLRFNLLTKEPERPYYGVGWATSGNPLDESIEDQFKYEKSPKKFREVLLNVYGYCAANKI